VLDIRDMSKTERQNALNEIRLLASVRHPSVMSYYSSFVDKGHLHIATELAEGGDLEADVRKRHKTGNLYTEEEIWKYFAETLLALRCLHERRILHRDLKSANILLTKDGHVKLADFGVGRILKNEGELARTRIGTPYYLSPEVWQSHEYDSKSDVWSLGVLFFELIALRYPFNAGSVKELGKRVVRGKMDKIPKTATRDMAALVTKILVTNPSNRPTIKELCEFDLVKKNCGKYIAADPVEPVTDDNELVGTLVVPLNMSIATYDIQTRPKTATSTTSSSGKASAPTKAKPAKTKEGGSKGFLPSLKK